jgi:putative transposase
LPCIIIGEKVGLGHIGKGGYHATMVDSGASLWACLQYIDLNMVRAGVVRHPEQWQWTGWQEIMEHRKRYCLIDQDKLIRRTGHKDLRQFREHYEHDLTNKIHQRILQRESQWTEAVAVGIEAFVKSVTDHLPDRRRWQIEEKTVGQSKGSILREPSPPYMRFLAPKNAAKALSRGLK